MYLREQLRELVLEHRHFLYYATIGLSGAVLDFILYLLLYKDFGIPPFAASFLSTSAGIINNFFLNARFNFKKSDTLLLRLASFYIVGLLGALLSVGLIIILHNGLNIDPTIAKILTIPPVVLMQFFINKQISFNDSPASALNQLTKLLTHTYRPYIIGLLSAVFYFSAIYFIPGHDEMDNMLGGKLILNGQLPFSDFFSHHAPGMYYLAAIIYAFVSDDIFLFRLAHNIVVFALILVVYRQLHRGVGQLPAEAYLLLSGLSNVIALGYMALAESLISQLFILSLVFVFLRKNDTLSVTQYSVLSAILFCIPFMSLGYIFLSLIVYAALARLLASELLAKQKSVQGISIKTAILALPYILYGGYVYLSGIWRDIYYNLFTYNSSIYADFANEVGGGIVNTLKHSIFTSYEQIATVLFNPGNYFIQWLLLSGFLFFAYYLWTHKRYLEAILIPPILLLLNSRVNIFNPPAITSALSEVKQHGDMYISVAIFALSIGSLTFLQAKPKFWQWQSLALIPTLALILVPWAIFNIWSNNVDDYIHTPTDVNYYQLSRQVKQYNAATPINLIANADDRAWIGPADFRSQLYLQPKRATYFTFFQPHIAASQVYLERFTSELAQEKPIVIYFNSTKIPDLIHELLNKNYFQLPDSRLKDYYFLTDRREDIIERLAQHDYQTY